MSISRKVAWSSWSIVSVFYAYQYILRVMPNIMLTDIMHNFNIDAAVYGQFSGAYYLGYCLIHIPIGIMFDKYGPRKVMTLCILLTVIGLLPIIFAERFIYPIMGRFLIGMGSSAAILGAFQIIRIAFDEKWFTRMLSFSVTIGLVGAIYGGMPVSYLCKQYGYKSVIEIVAIIGVVFACITYIIVPETKSDKDSTVTTNIKTVFSNCKVLTVCILAGLMVGPMEGFADAWGAEFFKQVYGFDETDANYLTSMIYLGMFCAPVLSRIAEFGGRYVETIGGAGFIMLLAFIMLIFKVIESKSIIAVVFFIVGTCCAYQILAIYKASTYVAENVAGLTTAIANMIIMSFGYIFHSLIGVIITACSSLGIASAFTYAISIIPIALFIGTVGFLIIAHQER